MPSQSLNMAAELSNLKAAVNNEKMSKQVILRNKAYVHMKTSRQELIDHGKYLHMDDSEKRKKYQGNFKNR